MQRKNFKEVIRLYQQLMSTHQQEVKQKKLFTETSEVYLNLKFIAEQPYNDGYYSTSENEPIKQASYILGKLHYEGELIAKDVVKALQLFEKAAKQNYIEALRIIGDVYYLGKDIPKDYTKAATYFKRAAEDSRNCTLVDCYNYAWVCHHAQGVTKNIDEAIMYYLKAENYGHADSSYQLGLIYNEKFLEAQKTENSGYYVRDYLRKAVEHYEKAVKLNHKKAPYALGIIYFKNKEYKEAIVWHQKLAFENEQVALENKFFIETSEAYLNLKVIAEQAYKEGYHFTSENEPIKQASYILGKLHYEGKLVSKDIVKALQFFEKAAKQNHIEALRIIGDVYYLGKDMPKDYTKAAAYFKQVVEVDNGRSNTTKTYFDYAYVLQFGLGITKDVDQAIELYKKAISLYEQREYNRKTEDKENYIDANYQLGQIYSDKFKESTKSSNNYYAQDYRCNAIKYYQKAIEYNHIHSNNYLGIFYYNEKKYIDTLPLFKKAAELGLSSAMYNTAYVLDGVFEGISKDKKLAFKYYTDAANKEYSSAQYILSQKYEIGDPEAGVEKNVLQAFWWLLKAIINYNKEAENKLKASKIFIEMKNSIGENLDTIQSYLQLEKELCYKFNNPIHLYQALNRKLDTNQEAAYQKLEFLGDGLLTLIIKNHLYDKLPNYSLDKINSVLQQMVRNDSVLLKIAKFLSLEKLLILGENEQKNAITDKMLADAMEAVLGAIFKDSKEDYKSSEKLVIKFWQPYLELAIADVERKLSMQTMAAVEPHKKPTTPQYLQSKSAPITVTSAHAKQKTVCHQTAQEQQEKLTPRTQKMFSGIGSTCTPEQFEKFVSMVPDVDHHNIGKKGDTALMTILRNKKLREQQEVPKIQILIKHGASWTTKNKKGETAEDLAKKHTKQEVVSKLMKLTI